MRWLSLLLFLVLLMLEGCQPPVQPLTAEELLKIARDTTKTRDERGPAMFRIFADHIPPNSSSNQVREIFDGFDWLSESEVHRFGFQSGVHPLWIDGKSSLFRVDLFAKDTVSSNWLMYIRLSGGCPEGAELADFFGPKGDAITDATLVEFALWKRDGGIEIFDAAGRHRWK